MASTLMSDCFSSLVLFPAISICESHENSFFVCVLIVCHQQRTCSMLTIHLLNWCLKNTQSTFLHSIMLTEEASEVRAVFLALQLTFPVNFWVFVPLQQWSGDRSPSPLNKELLH